MAIHAVHRLDLRHLRHARGAPSCPEVHQDQIPARVFTQRLELVGTGRHYTHRLALDGRQLRFASFFFVHPFRGAPHRWRLGQRHGFVRQERVDGVPRVTAGHQGFPRIVVQPPLVPQLAFPVEDEEMRCRRRPVRPGNALRFAIIQIRKMEVPVRRARFHLLERITDVRVTQFVQPYRVGIVRLNGHKRHAFIAIVLR